MILIYSLYFFVTANFYAAVTTLQMYSDISVGASVIVRILFDFVRIRFFYAF